MALGSQRREGKSTKLPELPEEEELMPQQQQQPRAPKARQIVLPFVEPPIPRPSKYKEFGLQRGNMELPAFRREGSNRHIKGCDRASQQLKFKICALNNKEHERATELASLHDMESTSRALDEEEREIESAFPSSIRGEPSSPYAGDPQESDARPHKSNFSSPSSVANAGTHFDNNPVFSQTLPQHSAQPPFRRTRQLPLQPMLDAVEREKED
ncbi:hypothetical protein R1flu_024395 [Riccia fluitans]|uniref:Uncharacterized protein n=1 Tax=Riccia fluitans TaxID=41844 RepID=A0ABD1XYW7_9MARC